MNFIPKPVWAVGFAHEQTLRDATLAVFSFANFKTASAYNALSGKNGKFELTTVSNKDGAFSGEYNVIIQKASFENLSDEEILELGRQGKEPPKPKSLIPEKYNDYNNPIINIIIPETGNKNIVIELKD